MLQSTKLTVNNYIYIQYSDRKSDESLIVKNDFFLILKAIIYGNGGKIGPLKFELQLSIYKDKQGFIIFFNVLYIYFLFLLLYIHNTKSF